MRARYETRQMLSELTRKMQKNFWKRLTLCALLQLSLLLLLWVFTFRFTLSFHFNTGLAFVKFHEHNEEGDT